MKRRQQGARKKGFTLIELMIVVAIVGILAAFFVPMFLAVQKPCLRIVEVGFCSYGRGGTAACRVRLDDGRRVTVPDVVMVGDRVRAGDDRAWLVHSCSSEH